MPIDAAIIDDPKSLKPGLVLRHRDGSYVALRERKEDDSGWWLIGRGGLADSVILDGDLTIPVDPPDFVKIGRILDDLVTLGVPKSLLLRVRDWMAI